MIQIFSNQHPSRKKTTRAPVASVLSAGRFLFLAVPALAASLLVLSPFGNAFVTLPPSTLRHSGQEQQNKPRSGRSSSARTKLFVFSRLGKKDTTMVSRDSSTITSPKRESSNSTVSADSIRGYCPKCKRPSVVCICHALPDAPIDCGTRILILQVSTMTCIHI